jgi:hypothetical protein
MSAIEPNPNVDFRVLFEIKIWREAGWKLAGSVTDGAV